MKNLTILASKLNILTLKIFSRLVIVGTGALSLTTVVAFAGGPPAMFTSCGVKTKVKTPENSNGYYFSADCATIYVLPPQIGEIELSGSTKTYNTAICSSVASVFAAVEAKSRKFERLVQQIEDTESQINWSDEDDPWINNGNTPKKKPKDTAAIDRLDTLRDEIADSTLKVLAYNEKLSEYEGPRLRLTLKMEFDQLVRSYQKLNPKLDVQRMPLSKSGLTFIAKTSHNIGKAPAALDWNVAGLEITPGFFTGLSAEDLAKPDSSASSTKSVLFSSAVSGQVLLSLVGACPFYEKGGTMPSTMSASDISPYITASADYIYNVMVNRHYTAKYNMAALFKRIQKQTKTGGFFSSSTIHSLVIDENSKGWFEFKSLSEDNRMDWDKQLSESIKAQLINRLLSRIGAEPVGKVDSAPSLINPGERGAEVIGKSLTKCPHLYCQVAGYALLGLDSVFGSSTAASEFIRTQDHWEVEEVNESRMLPLFNQLSFEDSL